MIYTLGCSFTKWYWHTWSDWLEEYSTEPVINLGWIGLSNETIYWELIARNNQIMPEDTVYVMFTGNNRVSVWYDEEWINHNKCKDFFPGKELEFGTNPWHGMYRLHPDQDVSLTHMIVNNFNIIYQTQQLLNRIGCKHFFMFWQNPWYDVRPKFEPSWKSVWPLKNNLTKQDLINTNKILKLRPVVNLLNLINWDNFLLEPEDVLDPSTYKGMWEYKIDKQVTEEFISYAHEDPHPDTVIHHDFCTDILLEKKVLPIHRDRAKKYAYECLKHKVIVDHNSLITNNYEDKIAKMY